MMIISMKVYYDKLLQIWEIRNYTDNDWANLLLPKNYYFRWYNLTVHMFCQGVLKIENRKYSF